MAIVPTLRTVGETAVVRVRVQARVRIRLAITGTINISRTPGSETWTVTIMSHSTEDKTKKYIIQPSLFMKNIVKVKFWIKQTPI